MATDAGQMEQLAGRVHDALGSADLNGYWDLLDPEVTWGAPGDVDPGCRTRDQVLAWYRRARAAGVRAEVTETVVDGTKILVGLRVRNAGPSTAPGESTARWQVPTVRNGLIVDIRGFEERTAAVSSVR